MDAILSLQALDSSEDAELWPTTIYETTIRTLASTVSKACSSISLITCTGQAS